MSVVDLAPPTDTSDMDEPYTLESRGRRFVLADMRLGLSPSALIPVKELHLESSVAVAWHSTRLSLVVEAVRPAVVVPQEHSRNGTGMENRLSASYAGLHAVISKTLVVLGAVLALTSTISFAIYLSHPRSTLVSSASWVTAFSSAGLAIEALFAILWLRERWRCLESSNGQEVRKEPSGKTP